MVMNGERTTLKLKELYANFARALTLYILEYGKVIQMNDCCLVPSYAKIIQTDNPKILWRVICDWCGLIIYENEVKE